MVQHYKGRARRESGRAWGLDHAVPTRSRVRISTCVFALLVTVCAGAPVMAQGEAESAAAADEIPLIDRPPFDVIVLTPTAGGKSIKIAPVTDRTPGQRASDTTKLEVVLLSHPDRRYEILWKDISKIDLYEQMVYDEAKKQLEQKDFVTAFMNLSFLLRNFPKMPNLEELRREFLFQSATVMFAESKSDFNRYFQTLSTLEELRATAADFKERSVIAGLSNVTDTLMHYYQDRGDLASAKKLLEHLDKEYGSSLPSVKTWQAEFLTLAESRKAEAKELMEAGKFREARKAALDMINISSTVEGGADLFDEIRRRHPMVRVGVLQRAVELDPSSLYSWSARRAGTLVYRPVVGFSETGSEGGKYQFALGKMKLSEDHQQLTLSVDPKIPADIDAFQLTQLLATRATPESMTYDASWAAIVRTLSTPSPTQIVVQLQRPHVLPHALLQFIIPPTNDVPSPLAGAYRLEAVDGSETSFQKRSLDGSSQAPVAKEGAATGSAATGDQPVEIVEVLYSDPKDAMNDLLRGEIDALDQLYPADAQRYGQSKQLKMGTYALPSVHMLVPVSDYAYLSKDKFRRALMYATDRSGILKGELLNSEDSRDGRLISGPFPIGIQKNDPLSYAYDASIEPMAYEPRLAKLLLYMVDTEMAAQSSKFSLPIPEKRTLRLGVPDFEIARVAALALIQQWSLIGVKAELVLMPEGKAFDRDSNCDLVYVTATMSEPAIDIERMLGASGPAPTHNPFIVQALTRLRQARSWREVRTALQDLHRLVDYHLPLLPLWQITDRFVASPQLRGLQSGSVTLYQDIDQWRLQSTSLPVSTSRPTP